MSAKSQIKAWWRNSSALPWVVLGVGLVLAVGASQWQRDQIEHQAQLDFQRGVERIADDIRRRMRQPIYGLRGAAGVYAANKRLTRTSFTAYVASRDLEEEFPGVRGLGLIQRVARSDLSDFLASERADGAPDFEIRQLTDQSQPDLFVIKYIVPEERNQGALGLDVGSEAVRRSAAEAAVRRGQPTLSGAITLVQDDQRTPGFLLYVPLYANGHVPTTVSERERNLVGLLYTPIVALEMFKGVAQAQSSLIRFELFDAPVTDVGQSGPSTLVFDSGLGAPTTLTFEEASRASLGESELHAHAAAARYRAKEKLVLAGHELTLRAHSTPAFDAAVPTGAADSILALGIILSVLLAGIVLQQQRNRLQAEAAARGMTVDLARLALVAQRTSNVVIITDAKRRITWVNEGFRRLYGYSDEQVLGRTPTELLSHPDTYPESLETLRKAAQSGTGCRVEVVNRTLSGQAVYVDTEVQPTFDVHGHLIGFVQVASDITASKQAEREIAKRTQALANIVEGTGAGTWEWNLETGATTVNERWAGLLGYSLAELGDTSIRDWKERIHADDIASVRQMTRRHLRGEVAVLECEARYRHRTGHWVWVLTRGKVVSFHADGSPRILAGTHIDISDRKQTEAERAVLEADLRDKSQLVDTVFENLPCGLSVVNAELKMVLGNKKFRSVLDLPDSLFEQGSVYYEDVIRFNAARGEYGNEDIETRVQSMLERARQPAVPHRFERTRPDGTCLEIQGAPMPGGGFVTTYTDITARKRAEAEADRSASLLKGAMEAIDEGFVLYDPDDKLVFCNERYRQIYANVAHLMVPGVRFEELVRKGAELGHYADAIGRVDDWVAERMSAHLKADSTLIQKHSGGRTLRIVERKMPDGHIVGFRIDISELVQASEAAQAASAAKSQFLANMSHEIRTPMNAILGMLKLLRKTGLDARQSDYAGKTEGAARSLLRLLNDILDFSKVDAGKMVLDVQAFSTARLLRDVSDILVGNVGDKPVDFRFDIEPNLPSYLVGDALRLQQVLVNLGGNAIKFTPRGEVVLSMRVVSQDADSVQIEIAVRDTGIGIAPENQARIFDGFSQAEASITRRFGGTGLGVAISQRLVALMGGTLKLESALGAGSRFHFCVSLPLASRNDVIDAEQSEYGAEDNVRMPESNIALAGAPLASTTQRLRGMRVLVVEDNLINQQVASELLEGEGAMVQIARNGLEALEALTAANALFDVVLMDLQMPVMDGFTATARIRHELGMAALPIIAMTANAMPSDKRACLAAGMQDHIGKPFDLDRLVRVILEQAGREAMADAAPNGSNMLAPAPAFVTAAAEAAGVKLEAAVSRLGGKFDLYRQLLGNYLEDLPSQCELLRKSITANDFPTAIRVLHTLKGLSATLGAEQISAAAGAAEKSLKAQTAAVRQLPISIDACSTASERTLDTIASCTPGLRSLLVAIESTSVHSAPGVGTEAERCGAGCQADANGFRTALIELTELLRHSDLASVEVAERLPRPVGERFAARLQAIDASMAKLDFESALGQCERLIEALQP